MPIPDKLTPWELDLIEKGKPAKYKRKADGQVVTALRFDPLWVHRTKLPEGINGYASIGADNWGYCGCIFWLGEDHDARVNQGEWVLDGKTTVREDVFLSEYEKA